MFRVSALALTLAFLSFGGTPAAEWDVDGIEELIPRAESQLERDRFVAQGLSRSAFTPRADPPPAAPIRNCAEWEPITGVMIRYPLGLPYQLLRDLDDFVTLHVVVRSTQQSNANFNLNNQGVDMSQVEFLTRANDSIWTRDYGPWFIFDGNGDLGIIDHVYNRPFRPNDNLIPVEFGGQQGIPVYSHDMYHTGGNYMTDGGSFSMSTDLVYDEAQSVNGLSPAQVDQLMADYYGITEYNVVNDIEAGGIHHIDTWGKFLDEETVIIKETWPAHYTYAALEDRATLIASLPASTGRNYQVHRVYCYNIGGGQPASYSNSLFVNNLVCVPLFGNSTYDDDALDVYRAALPGYDVRGYVYGSWLHDDALHCRTKGVMDVGMLRVSHVPVRDAQEGDVVIQAEFDDRSETGLTATDLSYRIDGGGWNTVAMTNVSGDLYEGTIPAPPSAGTVDYYLLGADNSGRQEGMPRVAPAHWYTFPISPSVTDAPVLARLGAPQVAPNPFRSESRFSFELRRSDHVSLEVYDVSGRRVRSLVNGVRPAGANEIVWDGRTDDGRPAPAGVYFFRLRAVGLQYAKPVTLTR